MPESKFLESGLTQEYREKFEERDPVRELQEDLELYGFVAESIRNRVLDLLANSKFLGLKKEDLKVIDGIEDYLDSIEKSLSQVRDQGELFETAGDKKPVKIAALDQIKEKIVRLFIIMNGLENIGHKVTKKFGKVGEFSEALAGRTAVQFYERYFGERIAQKEKDLEKLTGTETALFNSGMSAIETVLQNEELRSGDVIVVGENFYSQTKEILAEYEKKGVKVVRVDTGDTGKTVYEILRHKPKLIFLETIANAPRMEAADLDKLMETVKQENDKDLARKMRLAVDNTFLTPALNNLMERARKFWPEEAAPVVGVESATKYYQWGLDNINCGIVYSEDPRYMERLKTLRSRIGTNLQGKLASFLPELPRDLFEQKMRRHSDNALLLAGKLEKLHDQFETSYPGLASHRDNKTAQKEYQGSGGIIYLTCRAGVDGGKIVDQLKETARKGKVGLNIGGSFGHPETWIAAIKRGSAEKPEWVIRIAAGSENIGDFRKVIEVFEKTFGEFMF